MICTDKLQMLMKVILNNIQIILIKNVTLGAAIWHCLVAQGASNVQETVINMETGVQSAKTAMQDMKIK